MLRRQCCEELGRRRSCRVGAFPPWMVHQHLTRVPQSSQNGCTGLQKSDLILGWCPVDDMAETVTRRHVDRLGHLSNLSSVSGAMNPRAWSPTLLDRVRGFLNPRAGRHGPFHIHPSRRLVPLQPGCVRAGPAASPACPCHPRNVWTVVLSGCRSVFEWVLVGGPGFSRPGHDRRDGGEVVRRGTVRHRLL